MAKEATLQVRMDASLKEQVEQLYKDLGTSFAEAVRIFARQSISEQGMPFVVRKTESAVNSDALNVLMSFSGTVTDEIDAKK
ncbi:DNA-damage-inducible protein J, partial [Ruminococcus sp. YE71]|uniref:type II toxin-antitoxin system RelB/DinJ family antitoxin n=1 Tax=unclassified Ruminococcus TaxID=2608920 RepID=UPI00088778A1